MYFNKKFLLHPKLADFVGKRYSSRVKVNRVVIKYIRENGLAQGNSISPDEKLENLIKYNDYCQRVKEGRVLWKRRNRDGEIINFVETSCTLTYAVIQHLLALLYQEQGEITRDLVGMRILLNENKNVYLLCELMENENTTFEEIYKFIQF